MSRRSGRSPGRRADLDVLVSAGQLSAGSAWAAGAWSIRQAFSSSFGSASSSASLPWHARGGSGGSRPVPPARQSSSYGYFYEPTASRSALRRAAYGSPLSPWAVLNGGGGVYDSDTRAGTAGPAADGIARLEPGGVARVRARHRRDPRSSGNRPHDRHRRPRAHRACRSDASSSGRDAPAAGLCEVDRAGAELRVRKPSQHHRSAAEVIVAARRCSLEHLGSGLHRRGRRLQAARLRTHRITSRGLSRRSRRQASQCRRHRLRILRDVWRSQPGARRAIYGRMPSFFASSRSAGSIRSKVARVADREGLDGIAAIVHSGRDEPRIHAQGDPERSAGSVR